MRIPRISITCGSINELTFPPPFRQWSLNDFELYNVTAGEDIDLNPDFETAYPGLLSMSILSANFDGRIVLMTFFENVTDEELMAYQQVFGTWRCTLDNIYGDDTAVTVIRRCGNLTT